MTVGELVARLTSEAAGLPAGLDTRVVCGVEDEVEGFGGVYTEVEVAQVELGRRGGGTAVWVRGVAGVESS